MAALPLLAACDTGRGSDQGLAFEAPVVPGEPAARSPAAEALRDPVAARLAPFEASVPEWIGGLGLPPDRSYVLIGQVLSAYPVDLSTLAAARRSMIRMFLRPVSALFAATGLGHMYVGWHGPGGRGMVSKTGDSDNLGIAMAFDGWGAAPLISTFLDGRLIGPAEPRPRQAALLSSGLGSILAFEVEAPALQAMRRALASYIADPREPARRYGLLLDPDRGEGDGCQSFALWLLRQAGVGAELLAPLTRGVAIHRDILGRRPDHPERVLPYLAPGDSGLRRVTVLDLVRRDWDSGPQLDNVRLVDGELFATLSRGLRRLVPDARPASRPALGMDDPQVAELLRAAGPWVTRWPRRRIARPDAMAALVLETG